MGSPPVHAQQNPGHPHTETPTTAPAVQGSPATRQPSVASSGPHDVHKPSGAHQGASGDEIGTLAIGAGIFGLAAIGLVGALDRRRRRQSARRTPGRRIPLPAPHSPLADLELQLRHYARADSLFWLTRLGDLLAHAADRAGVPRPEVLGVDVRPHGLDVFVTEQTGDPPAPFESESGEPGIWHLPVSADPSLLDDTVVAEPVPLTLITVGQGEDGTLLVNLDHYRSVHIEVPADQVPGTLAAIGTELAASTGSHARSVVAVGFGHGVIDRLDGGIVTDDLDSALAHIRPGEDTVVLVDAAMVSSQLAELGQAVTLRLVTAGPLAPAGVGLVIDPANPTLAGQHLEPVEPAHVAEETLADVDALLDLAEAPADARPADEPYRVLRRAGWPSRRSTGRIRSSSVCSENPALLSVTAEPGISLTPSLQ